MTLKNPPDWNRLLSLSTNPAGLMAAAGAIYAAVVMITNSYHHHGVLDPEVIVSAIGAVAALFIRQSVTPVADPKDRNGNPLAVPPPVSAVPPWAQAPAPQANWVTVPPVPPVPSPPETSEALSSVHVWTAPPEPPTTVDMPLPVGNWAPPPAPQDDPSPAAEPPAADTPELP